MDQGCELNFLWRHIAAFIANVEYIAYSENSRDMQMRNTKWFVVSFFFYRLFQDDVIMEQLGTADTSRSAVFK